jgi:hypothetical protein
MRLIIKNESGYLPTWFSKATWEPRWTVWDASTPERPVLVFRTKSREAALGYCNLHMDTEIEERS